jgi:hypothetical protein
MLSKNAATGKPSTNALSRSEALERSRREIQVAVQ